MRLSLDRGDRAATHPEIFPDTSRSFNTELLAALELANMLDIGECILRSGLQREESRGAHQRTDFPDRDDDRFLSHQVVHRASDGARGSRRCR